MTENLICVFLTLLVTVRGLQRSQNQLKCLPVKANIFWDRSNVKDTFDVQRNYILQIINNTAHKSTVYLNTFDNRSIIPIQQGIKDEDNLTSWMNTIINVTIGTSEDHTLPASNVIESIADNQSESSHKAIEVFLVVNDQTRVNNESKLVEGLQRYKAFVVFYGKREQSKFWRSLATDDNHFVNPHDNLEANVEDFFHLMCHGRSQNQLKCLPVKANIFWDRSNVKDTFDVQRNYILQIINNTAHKSTVYLNTFDNRSIIPIQQGIKDEDNLTSWMNTIINVTIGTSEDHTIPSSNVIESIADNQNESSDQAREVFLVVNDQTRVDESKLVEGLQRYKTFVVFYGKREQSNFWRSLATDDNHFVNPHDNLEANVEDFFHLMCHDSYYCDINMYWDGYVCKECTYICATQPSYDSPFCREKCPYYRQKQYTTSEGNSLWEMSNWKIIFNITVFGSVVNVFLQCF